MELVRSGVSWTPDVTALRAFSFAVRERQLRRAAGRLGLSVSTLSRQVQRLERDLGVELLVRAPGEVIATPAGQRLLAHVEHLLSTLEQAWAEVTHVRRAPRDTVSVGAIVSVGTYVLPKVVARFNQQYTDVTVVVREAVSDDLGAQVTRGELEMAIVALPIRFKGLTRVTLWREGYELLLPPGHRLEHRATTVSLTEVIDESIIMAPSRTLMTAIEAACASRGVQPKLTLVTDNLESVRAMVEAGVGIAILPSIVTRGTSSWRSASVAVSLDDANRQVVLVHRGARHLTSAARAFLDAVVDSARP